MAKKTTGKKSSGTKPSRSQRLQQTRAKAAAAPHAPKKSLKKSAGDAHAKSSARPAKAEKPAEKSKTTTPQSKAEQSKGKMIAKNTTPAADASAAKSASKPLAKLAKVAVEAGAKPTAKAAKATLGAKGKKTRTVAEAASTVVADSKGYVFINGRRVRMISTKGQVPIKKSRPNGTTTDNGENPDQLAIRAIKTKLSRKELNHYRELLLMKRREIVGDLHAMENEALRSGGGNLSHMPIHMADIGTDTFDQDFMLGLAANERDQLREIDAALQRIQDNTFGICQMTGKPIPKARLDAKPWAKYTIEAARQLEGQWNR